MILTSGIEGFGIGETEEEAIQDAIKKSAYPTDDGWQSCTREWIDEQIGRFSGVVGVGLYFSEDDEGA